MNCYNHHHAAAVAICKNCSKGLCPECLTEVENGIACTATCIEEVKTVNALINNSKKSSGRAASSYYRNAFIYAALALLFFYSGIKYDSLKTYGIAAGCIFLIGSLLLISTAGKYKKNQE
jgi:hypothetical protein